MAAIGSIQTAVGHTFLPVDRQSEHFATMERVFKETLTPLYGEQEGDWKKIARGKDRQCEVVLFNNVLAGCIVYKTTNQETFQRYGVTNSFEIKNFLLLDQSSDTSEILLKKVIELAKKQLATTVHLVLSEHDQVPLSFLQSNGFYINHTWRDSVVKGVGEHLLSLELQTEERDAKRRKITLSSSAPGAYVNSQDMVAAAKSNGTLKRKRDEYEAPPPMLAARLTSSTIQKKYLYLILNGSKTIEGRINSGMFAKLRVGEQIQFFNGPVKALCNITRLTPYNSFGDMLRQEGVQSCLPDVRSLEDATRIYDTIPGYAEKAQRFGVLAIKIKLVQA